MYPTSVSALLQSVRHNSRFCSNAQQGHFQSDTCTQTPWNAFFKWICILKCSLQPFPMLYLWMFTDATNNPHFFSLITKLLEAHTYSAVIIFTEVGHSWKCISGWSLSTKLIAKSNQFGVQEEKQQYDKGYISSLSILNTAIVANAQIWFWVNQWDLCAPRHETTKSSEQTQSWWNRIDSLFFSLHCSLTRQVKQKTKRDTPGLNLQRSW